MRNILLLAFLLFTTSDFAQGGFYWIKFKDKKNNPYSLSNPLQFLSSKSIERRAQQNIALDSTDLPITKNYEDSVAPFITTLVHRLKWNNLIVALVDDPGRIQKVITEKKDTTIQPFNTSLTIHDTISIHYRITVDITGIFLDTIIHVQNDTIYDTIPHAGPIIFRDSIFIHDLQTANVFDSLRKNAIVDSIGNIGTIPPKNTRLLKKFEEVHPVDQHINYPNKYGWAYHQINMMNGDLVHQAGFRGQNITVAMMDNGWLHADYLSAFDSVRPRILGTWDFVHNRENVYLEGGHGTSTFSCVAGNLPSQFLGTGPDADFYLFETEDNNNEWAMEEYNWAAAAEKADSAGAQIFSTSLGYTVFDSLGKNIVDYASSHSYNDLTGDKTVITHAGNMAFSKGILVLNSAGNEGNSAWHYIAAPADGINVLAIGAVDSTGAVAGFSSRGPNASDTIIKPDLCAQGANSAVINTLGYPGLSSGTSFSCPIMAGCVASLWSAFPDKTAKEIRDAVVISADHFWTPDNNHGYGIPNFYNAFLLLKTNYNGNILRISNDAVIYPNPFTNELYVSLFNNNSGSRKIELFDMLGKKVYSTEIFLRNQTFELVKIEGASSFPTGSYLLQIDGDKNLVHQITKIK